MTALDQGIALLREALDSLDYIDRVDPAFSGYMVRERCRTAIRAYLSLHEGAPPTLQPKVEVMPSESDGDLHLRQEQSSLRQTRGDSVTPEGRDSGKQNAQGYEVRECRGSHYHVMVGGEDLALRGDPYKTEAEAWMGLAAHLTDCYETVPASGEPRAPSPAAIEIAAKFIQGEVAQGDDPWETLTPGVQEYYRVAGRSLLRELAAL